MHLLCVVPSAPRASPRPCCSVQDQSPSFFKCSDNQHVFRSTDCTTVQQLLLEFQYRSLNVVTTKFKIPSIRLRSSEQGGAEYFLPPFGRGISLCSFSKFPFSDFHSKRLCRSGAALEVVAQRACCLLQQHCGNPGKSLAHSVAETRWLRPQAD